MSSYKVDLCGVNTSKLPLLSNNEKEALLIKIKNGDAAAREEFITGNLRLVLSITKRFQSSSENSDDLFQIGCIGLIKAMENFDLSLGLKFSTYAVPMIMGEIKRYLRDNNSVRVSRSLKDLAYKAMQMDELIRREENRDATLEEISEALGVTKLELAEALEAVQTPISIYEPVYADNGDELYVMDQLSDKKNGEESLIEELTLKEAVKQLDDRENQIINLRFFQGLTQMEVAREINISQAQVSRLEKSAIKSMKEYLK
jgi:RNA polymerase sporulation-specific sigma factor